MSKNGFLLYGNYEEQVKRLNDAQAGELFKIILHYVNTGEMRKSSDALVDMVFSMIAFQLGFDMKRYEESCEKRREAGRKAGKASAEKRAKAKQEMKASANVNDCQRFQHDTDTEIDTDTVTETDIDIETDTETEKHNKTSRHPHHSSKGAGASDALFTKKSMDEVIPYGENQNPTTRGELAQMEALAGELIRKYCGRAAYENDVQNVFDKCYTVAELPNGELYAAYSPERAELLRYAFKQAGNAGSVNWKYIEGIYDNFEKRRIKTVEDAIQSEYAWQRGEMTA
ncbi:MAG: DnaD domain protein [Peptococcaceae bacterium]|nr:DnaD domain protein [Peptococcaceae bacterium]